MPPVGIGARKLYTCEIGTGELTILLQACGHILRSPCYDSVPTGASFMARVSLNNVAAGA